MKSMLLVMAALPLLAGSPAPAAVPLDDEEMDLVAGGVSACMDAGCNTAIPPPGSLQAFATQQNAFFDLVGNAWTLGKWTISGSSTPTVNSPLFPTAFFGFGP